MQTRDNPAAGVLIAAILCEVSQLVAGLAAAAFCDVLFGFAPLAILFPIAAYSIRVGDSLRARSEWSERALVTIQFAHVLFLIFQAAAIAVVMWGPNSPSIAWIVGAISGVGYVASAVRAIRLHNSEGRVAGPRAVSFSLRNVLLFILVLGVFFAYFRQVDWVVYRVSGVWQAAAGNADGRESPNEYTSRINLDLNRHLWIGPFRWESTTLKFWTPRRAAPAGSAPSRRVSHFHRASGRLETSFSAYGPQEFSPLNETDFIVSTIAWNRAWGDPLEVIDEFSQDESVPEWSAKAFVDWIDAHRNP